MDKKPRFFRRKILVRAGQYTYGLAFALFAVAISTGLIAGAVMIFHNPSSIPCPDGSDGCQAIILAPSSTTALIVSIAALSIPATLVSFLLGIVLSHRTFGPLVRIKHFVEQLQTGNYSARLKFRDRDHLGELAGMFNELADTLEKKHAVGVKAEDK